MNWTQRPASEEIDHPHAKDGNDCKDNRGWGGDYIHTYEFNSLAPAFGESGPTLAGLAKKYGKKTVIVNGGIVEGGDLVSLAKIALNNHDWPKKVQSGQPIEPFTGEMLAPTPTIKESELLNLEQISVQ